MAEEAGAGADGGTTGAMAGAGNDDSGAGAGDFLATIPEAYKAKPYMANIKSSDELYKQFDNAQSLIGAPRIPKEGADKADWDKFYDGLGRPEKPEGYSLFTDTDTEQVKKVNTELQNVFHEVGLSKNQVEKISGKYKEIVTGIATEQGQNTEKYNADFKAATEKIFGDDQEGSVEVATKLVDKYAPEAVKKELTSLSPEAMAAVAAVLKGVSDEYITTDDIAKIKGGTGGGSSATTRDELRAEMREIMGSKEFTNSLDQTTQKATAEKVQAIAKKIAALDKAAES